MVGLSLHDGAQAADRREPAAVRQAIGDERDLESARNPRDHDPIVWNAMVLERLERPVQQPPRHHFIVTGDDDGEAIARGQKFTFDVFAHGRDKSVDEL
jgi:hypothetical protein